MRRVVINMDAQDTRIFLDVLHELSKREVRRLADKHDHNKRGERQR